MTTTDAGEVVVRIPIEGTDVRDLRVRREHEVLGAPGGLTPRMPRLLHHSDRPAFQVHTYVSGLVLNGLAPAAYPCPARSEALLQCIARVVVSMADDPDATTPPMAGCRGNPLWAVAHS
ncbi:hypothetical protein [Nonomuraea sp. NPDC050643]|uniref:hypothetical protein n=1 Tax=Nonomuraea sp. NPDC050643 TaxID=3155660 RepID=UPI003405AF53